MKKKIKNEGTDKLPIVVHVYGDKAFCGKVMIEKLDDVRLLNALPYVVVGSGVMIGVGVIVIYGGESAFTKPTRLPSAHIVKLILEIIVSIISPPAVGIV